MSTEDSIKILGPHTRGRTPPFVRAKVDGKSGLSYAIMSMKSLYGKYGNYG